MPRIRGGQLWANGQGGFPKQDEDVRLVGHPTSFEKFAPDEGERLLEIHRRALGP